MLQSLERCVKVVTKCVVDEGMLLFLMGISLRKLGAASGAAEIAVVSSWL